MNSFKDYELEERQQITNSVKQQLDAMGARAYHIKLFNQPNWPKYDDTKTHEYRWSRAEMVAKIPWLIEQNTKQHAIISIKPSAEEAFININFDESSNILARLKEHKIAPDTIITTQWPIAGKKTGYTNAWIRVDRDPITPELKHSIGQYLQTEYGVIPGEWGDLASFWVYEDPQIGILRPTLQQSPRFMESRNTPNLRFWGQHHLERGQFVQHAAGYILQQRGQPDSIPENPPLFFNAASAHQQLSHMGKTYQLHGTRDLSRLRIEKSAGTDQHPQIILDVKDNKIEGNTLSQRDEKNFVAALNILEKGREARIRKSLNIER